MTSKISSSSKNILLKVARKSLENFLKDRKHTTFEFHTSDLLQHRAVFVTLREKDSGKLRGCIGHVEARYPLVEAVAKTAISSALEDSRFTSLSKDELKNILIEINVLTRLNKISTNEIELGKHGLMLCKGSYSAIYLPEVPINQGWDRIEFLEELSLKAGLNRTDWKDKGTDIFCFESESWTEN